MPEQDPGEAETTGGTRRRPTAFLDERQTRRIMLALIMSVPFVIALLGLLDGWEVLGDNAIIGIRVRNLLGGDLPLTGLPSTGENFGSGVVSNHPGPFALYVLVPFVVIFGQTAGMALGAAAINAASFGLAAWAGYRRGGVFLMAVVGFVLCLLARGLSPWTLIDPLSSNLGTFPSVAFALATWAVLEGDRRLLPAALVIGSFTFQAHLTYMAFGAGVSAVLIIGLAVQVVRDRETAPDRRTLVWSGFAMGLVWLPVLLDQFLGGGNISSIIRTFTADGGDPGSGWGFALGRLVHAVSIPPFFSQDVRGLDFLTKTPLLQALTGLPVALLIVYRTWTTRRRGTAPLQMLVLVTAVVGLVSIYSAAQLPSGATVKAANLRWMWTFGALWWATACWALVGLLLDRFGRPRPDRVVPMLIGTLVLGLAVVVAQAQTRPARDARAFDVAAELRAEADAIPKGSYRVTYEGGKALLTVGPSFAYSLRSTGSDVYVDAGMFGRGYGDSAIYTDQEVDRTYVVLAMPEDEFVVPDGYDVLLETSYREGPETIVTMLLAHDGAMRPGSGGFALDGAGANDGSVDDERVAEEVLDADLQEVAAFCEDTEEIDRRLQAFIRSETDETSAGTAAVALQMFEVLDIEQLEPSRYPEVIGEPLDRLLVNLDDSLERLRAQPDRQAEDVIDPSVIADIGGILEFWLAAC